MAKLIIEGELSQLLKIKKAYRLLEARKIVKCTLEGNKDQESESSPESETLPEVNQEQINEEVDAKDESVNENQEKVNEPEVENVEEITEEPVIEQQQITEEVIKQPESINAPEKKKGRPAKKVK